MSKVKSIDITDKQMRFLPILGNLLEIQASTKKKDAYMKVRIPDELFDKLALEFMKQGSSNADQYLVCFRMKDKDE